jgi:hypothetical protein
VALFISTWLWGTKWPPVYAERLFAGIKRNLREDYRSVLITDQPGDGGADLVCRIGDLERPYLNRLGCLARIGMFDRLWQKRLRMKPGDRVVCIDIDAVITGNLDPLFQERGDSFRIMQGFNSTNPCPFNGSLWMFRAGERHDVWDDFGPDAHRKFNVPIHAIADDQGWLHHKFPDAASYTPADGVYAFKKKTWPGGKGLPDGARIVAFPGRNPNDHADREWIKDNWGERC